MKISHINSYYFTNKLHEILLKKLNQQGFEQRVFIPLHQSEQSKAEEKSLHPDINFGIFHCFNETHRKIWPWKIFRIWKTFLNFEKAETCDLNHAHTLITNGIIAYFAKKKFGTPYIVTIRNTDINIFLKKSFIFRWMAKKILREAEWIITLSPAYWHHQLREVFSREFHKELENKHITISNGIDDFWINNLYIPKKANKRFEVLFVGNIDRNKNLKTLIEACELLKKKDFNIHLRVVGSGPEEEKIKRKTAEISIDFEGFVSEKNSLLAFYRGADVLVVPSKTESFGLVYAEAMSQATPVIYSINQGFDGFFPNGQVGYAIDAMNANEIADAIIKIKNNYLTFSTNALENASLFNWEIAVGNLKDVYEAVLSNNPK